MEGCASLALAMSCPQPEAAPSSRALVGWEMGAGGTETTCLQTFLFLG